MHRNKKNLLIGGVSVTMALVLGIAAGFGIWGSGKNSGLNNGGVQTVTFMSNKDGYLDAGFNEETYNGVSEFGSVTNQAIGIQIPDDYYDYGGEYENDVRNVYDNGGEILISSGFNIAGVVYDVSTGAPGVLSDAMDNGEYKDKSMYLLDDADLAVAGANENSGSVYYNSNEAGFLAGIAAALHSTTVYQFEEGKGNVVSAWGGIAAATQGFLTGYEQGINYFNYAVLGYEPVDDNPTNTNALLYDSGLEKVQLTWNGTDYVDYDENNDGVIDSNITKSQAGSIDDLESATLASSSWYTGGFDYPSGTNAENADSKSNNMKDTVNVIFPVAGGQTLAALNAVEGTDTQVIGVDSDAAYANPDRADNILGSSVKNLSDSAEYAAWYEEYFKPEADEYYTTGQGKDEVGKENWEGSQQDFANLTYENVNNVMEAYANVDPYYDSIGARNFATSSSDPNYDKGWNNTTNDADNIRSENMDNNGQTFLGTYENGGVGFTDNTNLSDSVTVGEITYDNESSKLDQDIEYLYETYGSEDESWGVYSFMQVASIAYDNQEYIDSASATFNAETTSNLGDSEQPWMLTDWSRA